MNIKHLAFLPIIALSSLAQPASFFVDGLSSDRVRITFPGIDLYSSAFASQITADASTLNLRFDEARFTVPTFTYTREQSFTVGFGETLTYTTTLQIDQTVISVFGRAGGHSIAPSGGIYIVSENYGYAPETVGLSIAGTFSGSYEIEGPNGTTSGTFTSAPSHLLYFELPWQLDAGAYPDGLNFKTGYDFVLGFTDDMFSTTIDGRLITSEISSFGLKADIGVDPSIVFAPGELAAIPEPSTWAMISGLSTLAGVFLIRLRRSRLRLMIAR